MYIASAVFDSKAFGITKLVIFTENDKQNEVIEDEGLMYLHYNTELCQIIMQLATKELPKEFTFREDKCKLISYAYDKEERYYNKHRENHAAAPTEMASHSEIIVYTGHCKCPRCYPKYGFSSIINFCGIVSLVNSSEKVEIDLQKCKFCSTFFMDRQSLESYEEQYGRLRIDRCILSDYVKRTSSVFDDYPDDSILSRNGYLAQEEHDVRRTALRLMLENGVSKAQIKDKLTNFIEKRGQRCYKAVHVWREDLEFVNNYQLDKEDRIDFVD